MNRYWSKSFLLILWRLVCVQVLAAPAEGTAADASIRGVLYVSYSGDPSYDVMHAKNVEVLLLRGDKTLEEEVENLKKTRLPKISAQKEVAFKAYSALRHISDKQKAKEKEMREALKRETETFDKLRADYEKDLVSIFEKYLLQKTKTDEVGKFRFHQLSPGRYFLHARYEISGAANRFWWLHPVEAKTNQEVEVTLNKSATMSIY